MASLVSFLDAAEIDILKRKRKVREEAMSLAAKKMQKDYVDKVLNPAISKYYEEYPPKIYNRRGELFKAFDVKFSSEGVELVIEFDWDSNRMADHFSNSWYHKSGAPWRSRFFNSSSFDENSQDNGAPENDWIFNNFLQGYHPGYFVKDGMLQEVGAITSDFETNIEKNEDQYLPRAFAIIVQSIKIQCAKYF